MGFNLGDRYAERFGGVPIMTADNVRSFRERAGLSQGEVAQASGFNQVTVSRVERGEISTPETIAAVHATIVQLISKRISRDCQMIGRTSERAPFELSKRGRKGARARCRSLSPERRKQIARQAANARWS